MSRSGRLRAAFCFLLVGGLVLLNGAGARAGEKFKITETPGKVDLPQDLGKEIRGPASDFLHSKISGGESSQGPVLPMPNQPSMIRNPMLEEWLDRKKNWIFDTPNTLDRDKAVKAIFGVRDSEMGSLEKKPSSVMEKYWNSGKEKKDSSFQKNSPENRQSTDRRNREDSTAEKYDPVTGKYTSGEDSQKRDNLGIIPALNPIYLFNSNLGPEGLNSPVDGFAERSILPPNLSDAGFGPKPVSNSHENTQAPGDFQRQWDSRKMPLSRLNDPINSQPDATRFAINPISARPAAGLPAESSKDKPSDAFAYGRSMPITTRPELLGPGRVLPTSPSFSPPAATPAPISVMQAKPAILEIPRPKF